MRASIAIMVAALVGVLGLTACGGGGSSSLTKSEFLTQADAICKKYDDQVAAAIQKVGSNPTQDQQITVLKDDGIPALQASHDQIAKLKPPKEDSAQVKQMLDDLQSGIDQTKTALDKDAQSVISGDSTAFDAATKDADAYGLKECGSSSGDSSSSGDGSSSSSTP